MELAYGKRTSVSMRILAAYFLSVLLPFCPWVCVLQNLITIFIWHFDMIYLVIQLFKGRPPSWGIAFNPSVATPQRKGVNGFRNICRPFHFCFAPTMSQNKIEE